MRGYTLSFVMPGLVPGIPLRRTCAFLIGMAGTSPAMTECVLPAFATSALHQIDVLNRDRAAVAEIDNKNGEPDRSLSARNGEHQQRKPLPDQIAEERRERHKIDIHRQ